MTEHEKIMAETGYQPSECSCNTCANMCKTAPCLGTPSDILRLINNGYVYKLGGFTWAAGVSYGVPPIMMIQADQDDHHHCVFLENNLCSLHTAGLKPIEGKLVQHKTYDIIPFITIATARTWLDPANAKTITLIVEAILKCRPKEYPDEKEESI